MFFSSHFKSFYPSVLVFFCATRWCMNQTILFVTKNKKRPQIIIFLTLNMTLEKNEFTWRSSLWIKQIFLVAFLTFSEIRGFSMRYHLVAWKKSSLTDKMTGNESKIKTNMVYREFSMYFSEISKYHLISTLFNQIFKCIILGKVYNKSK